MLPGKSIRTRNPGQARRGVAPKKGTELAAWGMM